MFSLYLDEDSMDLDLCAGLRARGFDVLTTREAERIRSRDSDQLECATMTKRVLYSANVSDFARLHRQYLSNVRTHSGIIVQNNQRLSFERQVGCLWRIHEALAPGEIATTIIFLENYL